MKRPNPKKTALRVFMALEMSNVPNVLMADNLNDSKAQMISASQVLEEITRTQAEKNVRDYLEKTAIKNELLKNGISSDEAIARLSILSEQEIRQLSGQVNEARAGGDVARAHNAGQGELFRLLVNFHLPRRFDA